MQELSIPDFLHKQPVYRDIYEQYATNAAFLWILRSIAVDQPHYNGNDILALEQRIDAQLNGLMSSADVGWSVCEQALELAEPGEVFTAMIVAMRSHESSKIQRAVEVGLKSDNCVQGLISALGWLPGEIVDPWIQRFVQGKEMGHKLLGLAACSIRRQDPGEALNDILQRAVCQQHEKLYARALRLIGELRRQDCMSALQSAIYHKSDAIRFWSNWSAVLLGHKANLRQLKPFVLDASSPYQVLALQLAFRVLTVEQARQWISELATDAKQIRIVIKATGILGDPHAVNWLIGKMADAKLAKLAGEAFSFITGIDLVKDELIMQQPLVHPMHPNDDIYDDNLDLDEDENLPYPDAKKVLILWRNHGQKFIVGRRYFIGQPITSNYLKSILLNGSQRQRHAAAIELAVNENGMQLPNTRAKVLI